MTKQYTNTREPGEFGDGVTVGLEPEAALSSGGVRVKPLEWESIDSTSKWAWVREFWCCYRVSLRADRMKSLRLEWRDNQNDDLGVFGSWEEAYRGAQADYERRILSAIEPTQAPEPEPVAYEVVYNGEGYTFTGNTRSAPAPAELEVVGYGHKAQDGRVDALSLVPVRGCHEPLVRLSDAQAAIAAKDGEIERLGALADGYGKLDLEYAAAEARNAELVKALEQIASQESPERLPGSHLSIQNRGQLAFAMIEAIVSTARAALHPEKEGE